MKTNLFIITSFIAILGKQTCKSKVEKAPEKQLTVETYSTNAFNRQYDSQWQGILNASDGNIYFANSTHSYQHGAGFFKFNPATKELTNIAEDITTIVGEDPSKTPPQGKIHSPFVEANGWIYFSTHLSTYWQKAVQAFTGAHIVGYEIATQKFKDFGILKPRYTVYSAITVDPERNLLYAFVTPYAEQDRAKDGNHLYSVNIATGEKKDLGLVNKQKNFHGTLWFFLHKNGDLWFSTWNEEGKLHRYSPATGKIDNYNNVLPSPKLAPDGKPAPVNEWKNSWTWVHALPGNERALFSQGYYGGGDERLWLFDPSKPLKEGGAFVPLAYTGTNFLSVALGGDRVYYIQKNKIDEARGYDTETDREYNPDSVGYVEDLHLRSVLLDPAKNYPVTDHGQIIDKDGRKPRMIESLAADDKGHVYFIGSWYLKPGEKGTLKHQYGKIEHGPLVEVKRGEFFGVADVSKQIE